ncbi:MAG: DNA gyrase inhibitor YacG [Sphingomonadales bacterium]|nr:MAG: DNA gyrase inhibitor YacG [Sphingomonadales bacterium]
MTSTKGCPICGDAAVPEFRPFCSRGCKDRDLLQWLGEGYRVPGEPADPQAQTGLDSGREPD